jgi:S1-C subfamily serine protease
MNTCVFHIFNKKVDPDYVNLWKSGVLVSSSGTGFGVKIGNEKYILTNAHVVEFAQYLSCNKFNTPRMFVLKIKDIAYEIDLALLSLDESDYKDFWSDVIIHELTLPPLKGETIYVMGFPHGGLNASITKGIVSRLISMDYYNNVSNLAIQVDSAINPGNSGGPVFNETNQIVGVAFSHSEKGQNMCYIIPSFIVTHFLESIKKFKSFPGICDLDLETQAIESESMSKYYGTKGTIGTLVTKVYPLSSASQIQIDDIILNIQGYNVYSDRTIFLENYSFTHTPTQKSEKVPFWHLVRMMHPGDQVTVEIIRKRKQKQIRFIIGVVTPKLVPSIFKNISFKYYIFGGLVFIPLNWHYFNERKISPKLFYTAKYLSDHPESESDQIVVLQNILQSELTNGYVYDYSRLMKIDSIAIKSIDQVAELCENSKEDFVKFEFENSYIIILDRVASQKQSEQISISYLKVSHTNIDFSGIEND